MTGLPAVSLPLELAGVDRRHHGDRGTMTGLPGLGTLAGVSFPPSIIGTTGTAARCQVDDRAARRHDDQLAGVSFPPSIVGTTGTAAR